MGFLLGNIVTLIKFDNFVKINNNKQRQNIIISFKKEAVVCIHAVTQTVLGYMNQWDRW